MILRSSRERYLAQRKFRVFLYCVCFVPYKTFSRNKTLYYGHSVPHKTFSRNQISIISITGLFRGSDGLLARRLVQNTRVRVATKSVLGGFGHVDAGTWDIWCKYQAFFTPISIFDTFCVKFALFLHHFCSAGSLGGGLNDQALPLRGPIQ